jgi:hypothetical protein
VGGAEPARRALTGGRRAQARLLGPGRCEKREAATISIRNRARTGLVDDEVEHVPAWPPGLAGALGEAVLAVVDKQPQLALGPAGRGDRIIGLAQRSPSGRERVDRVACAGLAHGAADPGLERRRHADDRLPEPEWRRGRPIGTIGHCGLFDRHAIVSPGGGPCLHVPAHTA